MAFYLYCLKKITWVDWVVILLGVCVSLTIYLSFPFPYSIIAGLAQIPLVAALFIIGMQKCLVEMYQKEFRASWKFSDWVRDRLIEEYTHDNDKEKLELLHAKIQEYLDEVKGPGYL